MCLPTCPTYDATKRERNSPRGRIALMRAIADGELEVSRTFADEMSYCLGCLACQTACPAGVNYAELFETARSDIEQADIDPSLSDVLARADARLSVHAAGGPARGRTAAPGLSAQRARIAGPTDRADTSAAGGAAPARAAERRRWRARSRTELIAASEATARRRRALASRSSPGAFRIWCSPTSTATPPTCCSPTAARSTRPGQPCCGSLHAHNGELELARELARRMIDLFPPDRYDAIISERRRLRLASAALRPPARR